MATEGDLTTMVNQMATLHVETLNQMQTVGSALKGVEVNLKGVEANLKNLKPDDEDQSAKSAKKQGMDFMNKWNQWR
jgi:hypothetical protein